MGGLDDRIAELAAGHGLLVALGVALLLGLRHATDPDHLTAVSTLVLSDRAGGTRRALALGLAWGAGHAITLFVLGLPVVLFRDALPAAAQTAAEVAIGLVIIALAVRLLMRWRRGHLHDHLHEHDGEWHAHPHVHEHPHADHEHAAAAGAHGHRHDGSLGRSPRAALGIGMLHGIGGSAGVSILLIGAISSDVEAVAALVLFASATALSMALVSVGFGRALATGPARRRRATLTPGFAALALVFGAWYALGALEVVPYVL
jgi:ABC-type nickel/cobalt efflux system permease component RcnA